MPWHRTSMHCQRKRMTKTLRLVKAKSAPMTGSTDIPIQYNTGQSKIVLEHILKLTWLNMKLSSKHPTFVPLLAKHHRQLLLHQAQEYNDWIIDWENNACLDKLQMILQHTDGHVRVSPLSGKLLPYTAGNIQACSGNIM